MFNRFLYGSHAEFTPAKPADALKFSNDGSMINPDPSLENLIVLSDVAAVGSA